MSVFWPFVAALLAACTPNPFPPDELDLGDPLGAWGDGDLACDRDRDCFAGETCAGGICQIERCSPDLTSSGAPMGVGHTVAQDQELAFADASPFAGAFWIDNYDPLGGDFAFSEKVADPIADIAGGRFDESDYEATAVSVHGSDQIFVPGLYTSVTAVESVAIAAGDVDGDGLDEVVALGEAFDVAVCHVDLGRCDYWKIDSAGTPLDVAVGDLDGDGYGEPVLLLSTIDGPYLYAFHPSAAVTGETRADYFGPAPGTAVSRIAAGDADRDGIDEVFGLDGDVLRLIDSQVDGTFTERYATIVGSVAEPEDVAAGDTDLDDLVEVVVVSRDGVAAVEAPGTSRFDLIRMVDLDVSGTPTRVALVDNDGDAPRARLVNGPHRTAGNLVPVMAMMLPPYHADYSDGVSSVAFGDAESQGTSVTDTISLGVSADVGTKPSFFGLFGVKLSAKIDRRVSQKLSEKRKITVGSRYSVRAAPREFGPDYGAVVLGWGCFDAYEYEVIDPMDRLAEGNQRADGERMVITVPLAGGEALYSTNRYNAMARGLGLPVVEVPFAVGDPTSYPRNGLRLDGEPIPADDLLFGEPESFLVSDVGQISWRNTVTEGTSSSVSMSTSLGASAGVEAFGVNVGGGVSAGWGKGYSLDVGSSALFSGSIPPIPDRTGTPEDEYAANRYTVRPWVYRQSYEDALGNQGAYWVMTYSVGE